MSGFDDLILKYTGSVKNVWKSPPDPEHLWFEYTDDYSVFDWGKMPDKIANKGKSLSLLGAYFFRLLSDPTFWRELPASSQLEKFDSSFLDNLWQSETYRGEAGLLVKGLPSHFVDLVSQDLKPLGVNDAGALRRSPQLLMKVLAAEVLNPEEKVVAGQPVYFYGEGPSRDKPTRWLIPLEVIFRFGMSKGSSLLSRIELNPSYAQTLGLKESPVPDQWFSRPVIEFSTKLEAKDRLLSLQEAILISRLGPEMVDTLVETALLIALGLHHVFGERGLELWDGKLEFVLAGNGNGSDQLLLADSIGPDELRLLYKGEQLSKEFLRQFYRTTPWAEAIRLAQDQAKENPGTDWKEICLKSKGGFPVSLPENIKTLSDHLYGVVANTVTGEELIPEQPSLEEFLSTVNRIPTNDHIKLSIHKTPFSTKEIRT
jgi:phosphoribosylaminoimidazole-succinocarboxamide synthase